MADVAAPATINVEVAYALPGRQWRIPLRLRAGSTVGEAIEASGLRAELPALQVDDGCVGIFSRPATLATRLEDGDRVELYRPLQCDPKDVRRQRAQTVPPRGPRR